MYFKEKIKFNKKENIQKISNALSILQQITDSVVTETSGELTEFLIDDLLGSIRRLQVWIGKCNAVEKVENEF